MPCHPLPMCPPACVSHPCILRCACDFSCDPCQGIGVYLPFIVRHSGADASFSRILVWGGSSRVASDYKTSALWRPPGLLDEHSSSSTRLLFFTQLSSLLRPAPACSTILKLPLGCHHRTPASHSLPACTAPIPPTLSSNDSGPLSPPVLTSKEVSTLCWYGPPTWLLPPTPC